MGLIEDLEESPDEWVARREVRRSQPPLDWLETFELTEADMERIENQRFVVAGLIPEEQITAIVGRAGAGKTTILFHEALTTMSEGGYTVVYCHADTYPNEAKAFRQRAMGTRVRYLTPDIKGGGSLKEILDNFLRIANAGERLDRVVIVFDTMKKLGNMIQKSALSGLMSSLRVLVGSGATIVLLGHVNKHKGADGKDVYEGTGDLENDTDNLVYLVADRDGAETLVSTICKPGDGMGKMRAQLEDITWAIRSDRTAVRQTSYHDTSAAQLEAALREKDATYIEAIREAINAGRHKQVEITSHCNEFWRLGERRVRDTLARWTGKEWTCEQRTTENNSRWYELIAPPPNRPKFQGGQTDQSHQSPGSWGPF